jgi:NAD(P)-dependent dehydrogenase (short-subunit alcohol dehydrogenase family)
MPTTPWLCSVKNVIKSEVSQTSVALVTGSRTGLGKFVTQSLVQRGYHVIVCSHGNPDWTLEGYEHILADVSNECSVLDLMDIFGPVSRAVESKLNTKE